MYINTRGLNISSPAGLLFHVDRNCQGASSCSAETRRSSSVAVLIISQHSDQRNCMLWQNLIVFLISFIFLQLGFKKHLLDLCWCVLFIRMMNMCSLRRLSPRTQSMNGAACGQPGRSDPQEARRLFHCERSPETGCLPL